MILMALVDADYKSIGVESGSYTFRVQHRVLVEQIGHDDLLFSERTRDLFFFLKASVSVGGVHGC
ncbi:hypothetical protein DPMN_070445 [Dreissena polymorpha]|uniref:Uncharacterized protein n=1 Tax=Dreissena polymorpha TaxID=45954 RepID=A0A9D3Z2Z6_DREPO|nr:hypothetical protein DPMN_070445 [Dreissena polymorpha]